MNFRLLSKLLGMVALLIGGTMVFSLPWAFPGLGRRGHAVESAAGSGAPAFETAGFWGLVGSIVVCVIVGLALRWFGRGATGRLYRKEAMAVVGLSWLLATILGALPFTFSGTMRSPAMTHSGTKGSW